LQKILIPVDGSLYSDRAATMGVEMARRYQASVTLLFVADTQSIQQAPVAAATRTELLEALHAANEEMLQRTAQLCATAGIAVETRQVEGSPATTIARHAEEGGYDLVVMGSMGLGLAEYEQKLLGSVTERVLRQVRCPVLVVK
jgi:nucleotide-binding universal stress UspA family protein